MGKMNSMLEHLVGLLAVSTDDKTVAILTAGYDGPERVLAQLDPILSRHGLSFEMRQPGKLLVGGRHTILFVCPMYDVEIPDVHWFEEAAKWPAEEGEEWAGYWGNTGVDW